jgi:hypothetical protein
MNGTSRFQPNKRMQLALRPGGPLPLFRGDCEFRGRNSLRSDCLCSQLRRS